MQPYLEETLSTSKQQPLIEFDNVSVSYGLLTALKNISFKINKGQLTYLIGPNGAGKSSLIKLITKEVTNDDGTLIINTNKIGYLPQTFSQQLKVPITVYEAIYTGFLKQNIFISKDDKKLIDMWLDKVGLSNFGKKNINFLSGGQRQRIFLLRALISNPDLLILDEPTSALDRDFRKSFYELIESLNNEGMTIIIVTHDLDHSHKTNGCILSIDEKLIYYGNTSDYLKERK